MAPSTDASFVSTDDGEQDAGGAGQHAQMLSNEVLRSFWEFATEVRRTRSVANRESVRLRGTWLTPDLVVQRVHGWGAHSVRLLCVRAANPERAARLRIFFEKDRRNLDGRLEQNRDPLDFEHQVLVKIPYEETLSRWVEHERRTLTDLAGLQGIPELEEPLFFEDINMPAATYAYCSAPNLQEQLEQGGLLPPEGLHRMISFLLTALSQAHQRGWLHTDLQPRDVLFNIGSNKSASKANASAPCMLCGWSHALRLSEDMDTPGPSLLEWLQQLPTAPLPVVRDSPGFAALEEAASLKLRRMLPPSYLGVDRGLFGPSSCARGFWEGENGSTREPSSPSLYSAPEQLLGLFTGRDCESPATDVYRVAGISLMAVRARGPLASVDRPIDRNAAQSVDKLRRLCHEALLRRAESTGNEKVLLLEAEKSEFATALGRLLSGAPDLKGCGSPELEPWFRHSLAREPGQRPTTAQEALEALDEAWSRFEQRELEDRHRNSRMDRVGSDASSDGASARRRLVVEPPPELAEMHVL